MKKKDIYDLIVVGAGHAGVEAALVAERLGLKVLLANTNRDRISFMSCNPAIGGLAKGHIVREIEALGGAMGFVADKSCIQFKRLNQKKGPAVRGRRMQCDKALYSYFMKKLVESRPGISLKELEVKALKIKNRSCVGVLSQDDVFIPSRSVLISSGTFMRAVMHIGGEQKAGGRAGDKATQGLSKQLSELGFRLFRLKTGTPPRLLKSSIDYSQTEVQTGDPQFLPFSVLSKSSPELRQVSCFLSYTNEKTHAIIRSYLKESPLFMGALKGPGPRYCPSVEEKISRFAEKARHQTFLEPEGLNSDSIYVQGLSTSLPLRAQEEFLRSIAGLENMKMLRPGYAVEYDFVEPRELFHRLETKKIKNLFLAGQINGSSGYEEAGGQGLLAGLNAALQILGQEELVLARDAAYIGVLIDDLVTKGTKEPYRMFSSRAEHRMVLREDNVWERLYPIAQRLKLLSPPRERKIVGILESRKNFRSLLEKSHSSCLHSEGYEPPFKLNPQKSLSELLKQPGVKVSDLKNFLPTKFLEENFWEQEVAPAVEVQIKYQDYILRQEELIRDLKKMENLKLKGLNFKTLSGLSSEDREKLEQVQPENLGQAERISGISASAIQALFIHAKKRGLLKRQNRLKVSSGGK